MKKKKINKFAIDSSENNTTFVSLLKDESNCNKKE